MRVVGTLFLLISLVLLGGAAWINEREKGFYVTALRADGTVVDMISRRSGRAGVAWAPQVQFTDKAGRITRFINKVATKPPAYHAGEIVTVVYSPSNSERAEIDSFFTRWGLVIIPGGIGALFLLIGAGLFIPGRPKESL